MNTEADIPDKPEEPEIIKQDQPEPQQPEDPPVDEPP